MSQNNDAVAPAPPDDTRNDARSAEPHKEVPKEDPTRRLLLYEVLLEEYETHRPPDGDTRDPSQDKGGQPRGDNLKKVMQPQLSDEDLQAIRDEGERKRAEAERVKQEKGQQAGVEFENKYNSELVSRFFTLLTKKQQDAAARTFESLLQKHADAHTRNLGELNSVGGIYVPESGIVTERAAIAELYGILDDYREQHRKKQAAESDEEKIGETEESKEIKGAEEKKSAAKLKKLDPDVAAFKDLIDELNREAAAEKAARDRETKRNGNGHGNGTTPGGVMKKYDSPSDATQAYGRTLRSALCLSGGGIRSATFNLGILQGLARHGLLDQFDYLSTVSGGGFIGGWLTAWMHRIGTARVVEELSKPPESPLQPEPHPLKHLRVFSNYLSPQVGLLSADTWTLISTMLRNLLLTWLVFVPFLLVMLMLPRMWLAILSHRTLGVGSALSWSFVIGVLGTWIALTYAGITLSKSEDDATPSRLNQYHNHEKQFLLYCLLPGVVSAAAFAVYWWRRIAPDAAGDALLCREYIWLLRRWQLPCRESVWTDFVVFSIILLIVPWLCSVIYRVVQAIKQHGKRSTTQTSEHRKYILQRLVMATVLIIFAQVATGELLYLTATKIFPAITDARLYAAFSVPLLLLVIGVDCTLIAGLTSSLTKDEDLEWWARSGAWLLIVVVAWSATHLLVLVAPSILLLIGKTLRQARETGFWDPNTLKVVGQALTIVGGVVSGIITLAGGFSGKTSARGERQSSGMGGRLLGLLSSLLAPIFLAFIILVLALGTSWLLTSPFAVWLNSVMPPPFHTEVSDKFRTFISSFDQLDHAALVIGTPLRLLFVIAFILLVVCMVMGIFINSNRFSLHYMWRDRIIRAYLGASRRPGSRRPNEFTGFDTNDNLYMHELRDQPEKVRHADALQRAALARDVLKPDEAAKEEQADIDRENRKDPSDRRKLFHILNVALNLAGGDNLAWQDRKAESLTVSPLHSGSYWLGYRRSFVYGGSDDGGISLGTAVAISGAFVSPNMGYMMSSPVVRFLMTLFNVRFGWWLGNPGPAGDEDELTGRAVASLQRLLGGGSGKPFEIRAPRHPIRPIVEEAFGKTNDAAPYVYLSDGGHFENLGLYEMVLRRCRFIVVSDASTDAGYSFDSLAQSIRQIRVDLGVPIELKEMSIAPPAQDLRGKYCAVGKIRYSCVDRRADDDEHAGLKDADFDGTLIYIKASMIGEEPRDVINYGQGSASFPQEVIVDQWFTEAQFESYRTLGSHIIDAICSGDQREVSDQRKLSLVAFERKVKEHNQMNFRAFNERVNYAALTSQFRRELSRNTPPRFEQRVSDYVKDLLS